MAAAGRLLAAALALAALSMPAAAAEVPVDLELVLAVDSSPSIDISEFFLQRQGYVAAFRDPKIVEAIGRGRYGRIAVTYFEWAGPSSQRVIVPWAIIDGADSAARFATALEAARTVSPLGTSISGALFFAYLSFLDSGVSGDRRVIDISGNGRNAVGPPLLPVRDAVLSQGVIINGLPLMLAPTERDLDDYYRACVIGGAGAFIVKVERQQDLEEATRHKLVVEIAGPAMDRGASLIEVAAPVESGCDG